MDTVTAAGGGEEREARLLALAREYSFRNRMDKGASGGPVLERGLGSTVTDVTGKDYLDYNSGQMCAALGHSHPLIVAAIKESRHADPREQQLLQREGDRFM